METLRLSIPPFTQLLSKSHIDDVAACALIAFVSAIYLLRGIAWDKPDPYNYIWYERPQEKLAGSLVKETRNIAQKLHESNKDIVVFFGSQSGTAEFFAHRLAREIHRRFGIGALSAGLSDFDPHTIAQIPSDKLAIFILSTFGEGDPSDNTAGLWEWLTKSTQALSLQSLRFVCFGLGNSSYKYYNRVVDVVHERLLSAGAQSLLPVGRADDASGGTEEDFMDWKESLFGLLQKTLGYKQRDAIYEPTVRVVEDESFASIDLHHGEPIPHTSSSLESPVRALPIVEARELFSSSSRNCLYLGLNIAAFSELKYRTGDHLVVWPSNTDMEVDGLLASLGLDKRRETPISITSLGCSSVNVPTPTTIQTLLRHYLEIAAPVTRDTVMALSQFAPSYEAKKSLLELGRSKQLYAQYIQENHVTIGRLLRAVGGDAVWENLPLAFIVENVPPLRPRYYSISSSAVVSPRQLSITAVMDVKQLHNDREDCICGLTSHYLLAQKQQLEFNLAANKGPRDMPYSLEGPGGSLSGGKIHAQIRRSKFKLPAVSARPIIMVAAGTGMAPFRGFLQERARIRSMGREVGKMLLFYGCRHAEQEFLYKDELEEYERQFIGGLEIITAFSRDGAQKVYVQDRIEERAAEVVGRLQADAHLYICGSANMAQAVGRRIGDAMKRVNEWNDTELRSWSERAKRTSRWQEDVWG